MPPRATPAVRQVVEKCDLSRQVYWKYCNSGEQLDAWQAIKHGTECATLGYECWRGRAHLSRRCSAARSRSITVSALDSWNRVTGIVSFRSSSSQASISKRRSKQGLLINFNAHRLTDGLKNLLL